MRQLGGNGWRDIVEMSVAMSAPFFVLLIPYWMGAIDAAVLMWAAHSLMFVTMLLAMRWRKDVYSADHWSHVHRHPRERHRLIILRR